MIKKYFSTIIFTFLTLLGLGLKSSAQDVHYGKVDLDKNFCKEYKITIKNIEHNVEKLYLKRILDDKVVDSASVKNGVAVFSKQTPSKNFNEKNINNLIPKGFYRILSKSVWDNEYKYECDYGNDQYSNTIYHRKSICDIEYSRKYSDFQDTTYINFDVVLNQDTKIDFVYKNGYFKAINSDENALLQTVQRSIIQTIDTFNLWDFEYDPRFEIASEVASTSPESFLGKFFITDDKITEHIPPMIYWEGGDSIGLPTKKDFREIIRNFDFTDYRQCNSGSLIFELLSTYFFFRTNEYYEDDASGHGYAYPPTETSVQIAEINKDVDYILRKAAEGGVYLCNYYSKCLFDIFYTSGYEPAMLYIYDNFDRGWIPENQERMVKRLIEKSRKITPGAKIPELIAYDVDGNKHSTKDITTRFTIIWFWDPDCDDCREKTPELHDLYTEMADSLDFEVFAVEINDDYERWRAFSEQHSLDDWINLSTSMGEPNIDFIEYFDIITTPARFLIDNRDNTIISHQIPLWYIDYTLTQLK